MSTAIESIWPGLEAGVPKPLMPYSPAIRAGNWVFIAGQIASDFKTGLAPEVRQANSNIEGELTLQSRFVLRNLANTIKASGCDPQNDMVRIWQWFTADRPTVEDFAQGINQPHTDIRPYFNERAAFFGRPAAPSSSLGVKELLCLGTRVEVDMICRVDEHALEQISSAHVTEETGEHAAGIRRGDWVFLAAQDAGDAASLPASGWADSTVEAQTDRIMEKLQVIADAGGSSLERAVKAEVYIGHPTDFAAMDRAWRRWFRESPPARVVIPWMGMGRNGARVEIALTLLTNESKLTRRTIEVDSVPPGLGHEPQAMKAGDLLFFSTQMAFDEKGWLAEGMVRKAQFPWYGSPGKAQMHYIMGNIDKICAAAGTRVENIVRRVCFHSDFQWFADSIEAWASYFPECKPASTTIRLEDPLVVPGANTLLDLIAYAPD